MRTATRTDPVEAAEEIKGSTKSPEAFRTISEASSELGVPQHVLRFWETKFSFIRPMKRAGGRRFYRRQDIAVLKGVRTLLHEAGYTIKGVQRLHKDHGTRLLIGAGEGEIPPPAAATAAETPHVEPPMLQTVVAANPATAEVDDGPSLDLFDDAPSAPGSAVSDTAILKPDARARLDAVLRDIEQVKASIDDLLAERED